MPQRRRSYDRTSLARPVVRSAERLRELAAWRFLHVVGKIFPKRLKQLTDLREHLPAGQGDPDQEESSELVLEEFRARVHEWTSANGISCPSVDDAAEQFALGQAHPPGKVQQVLVESGDGFEPVEAGSEICANPANETLDEFLVRARVHYASVRMLLLRTRLLAARRMRHDDNDDPFRYLALRLVGGYSWAAIARGDTPIKFLSKTEALFAIQGRKVAKLIGIAMPVTPGPRRGSKAPRTRKRRA